MNKKIITSLISVGVIACFTACGNGESNTPAKQAVSKRNDLESIEKNLAVMKALDAADSSVRSMQVENLENAQFAFRCIIADECKYNKDTKTVEMKLDESRLASLDNGKLEYKMSDESGKAQGTATLVTKGTPEQGILAYAEISSTENGPVQKLNFVDQGAWPENAPRNCSDLNGYCVPGSPIESEALCALYCHNDKKVHF